MILIIVAAFFAGFLAASVAHHLFYNDTIRTLKEDARTAILEQAHESFASGWMRCYSDEVTAKKRSGYDSQAHLLMPQH